MAKKSETKKNKKQVKNSESKKTVDTSFKEAFMADAKNTTFTEETVKELDEVNVEPTDNEPIEETNEVEVVNTTDEEQTETVLDESVDETNVEDKETVEEEVTTETETTEEVFEVPFVQIVGEEAPDTETVGKSVSYTQTEVEEEPQPKKEEIKPKKKRSTSKEVYGYHWMGLIYDE